MIVITLTIALVGLVGESVGVFESRYLDETVDPCDNFYQFACGNFDQYHERREDQPLVDLFTITQNDLVQIGKEILSKPKTVQDPVSLKKAKAAYTACVSVHKNEHLTFYDDPELTVTTEYGGMPLIDKTANETITWTQIGEISGKFGLQHFFKFTIASFGPDDHSLFVGEDNWDEPLMIVPRAVKSYDEVLEESFKKIARPHGRSVSTSDDPFDVFAKAIARSLAVFRLSEEELTKDVADIKEFMTLLFDGGIKDNRTEETDIMTLGQLQDWTQEEFGDEIDINWVEYFRAHFKLAGIEITEDFLLYIIDKSSLYGILNLVRQTDPKIVKNFVLLRTFIYLAPDSDLAKRQAFKEYYNSSGAQYFERSDYCVRKIIDVVDSPGLSFAVTSEYLRYHFDINRLSNATEIIQQVAKIFENNLLKYDWIDNESRDAIIQKIHNITIYLGYPEFVDFKPSLDKFYENLRICQWDNYGNSQRLRAFKQAYAYTQLTDPEFWKNSPFEVNAYTSYATLRIMSPLSMLSSSYFDSNDPILVYSRFASILAHELIHHFDSKGIGYGSGSSGTGILSNSSMEIFETKYQCLVDQYSQYYLPEIDAYVNGDNTLNENIADNGGFRLALLAFREILNEELIENQSEKYTLEQQFFINYATTWCAIESDDYLSTLTASNEHPANRFRVIGTLSNMEEFSEAFSCPVGSNMNPETKCVLW